MTFNSLLPSNATRFERAVEEAIAYDVRNPAIAPRPGAKLEGYEPFVPWLLWEYGLGEILPFLSDPQRALEEGILWQRLRGTPEALRVAFSWRALDGVEVFQEEPGQHYAAFQIDTGAIAPVTDIDALIALARLSAPARARLARIFHGYDIRRFKLDDTRLGEGLLSDYSGVWHTDGKTRLSFGRVTQAATPVPDMDVCPVINVTRTGRAYMPGHFILSVDKLDTGKPLPNPHIYHSHLFSVGNFEGIRKSPANFLPRRKFQKAQIILSDGPGLGETNARTPPPDWYFYSNPETAPLSEGLFLSEAPRMSVRKRITETFDRAIPGGGDVSVTLTAVSGQNPIRCSHAGGRGKVYRLSGTRRRSPPVWWADATRARARDGYVFAFTPGVIQRADGRVSGADRFTPGSIPRADGRDIGDSLGFTATDPRRVALPDGYDAAAAPNRVSEVAGDAAYEGQFWLPLYHADQPWSAVNALIGAMHKTETS